MRRYFGSSHRIAFTRSRAAYLSVPLRYQHTVPSEVVSSLHGSLSKTLPSFRCNGKAVTILQQPNEFYSKLLVRFEDFLLLSGEVNKISPFLILPGHDQTRTTADRLVIPLHWHRRDRTSALSIPSLESWCLTTSLANSSRRCTTLSRKTLSSLSHYTSTSYVQQDPKLLQQPSSFFLSSAHLVMNASRYISFGLLSSRVSWLVSSQDALTKAGVHGMLRYMQWMTK